MRTTSRMVLLGCALSLLTGCSGASYARSAAPEAVGGYPGGMAAAAPEPPRDTDMAADFRSGNLAKDDEERVASNAPVAPAQPTGNTGSTPTPTTTPQGPSQVAVVRSPMLIYTAQITMAVFEVNNALAQIEELGKELGGFLARRDDMSITIRVPVAAFDAAVRRIEKTGDMLHRNVTAQDVTEEFRDLEIRIRNARAVRDRLEQLLAKATKVEESVVVERELERVTGELERMEGKIKFLRDRAAFSTITVTYQPKAKEEQGQSPFRLPVSWLNELGLSRLLRL